ncbi:MAG TPA: endonuclease VII domain-containing protein [Patescibacteria group bacterium]|nr:endonuclease VII domain-containing protein [Patescibacteria group bacterium]
MKNKITHKIRLSEYYKKNRLKILERRRKRYPLIKDNIRNNRLKYDYGIDLEEYLELFKKQNGVCAICKNAETSINTKTGLPFALAVDHNHITKRVRGLLCKNCNVVLGTLNENIFILEKMINYLKNYA